MPHQLPRTVAVLVALAVAVVGWHVFWFLCDDAYIVFRYAHNLHVGRGPVWNPAPFLPVEGYTSPLWLLLLWGCWEVTGLEPPATANWLSLGCGLLTLLWIARALARAGLPEPLQRGRTALLFGCLLTVAGNRTFCTWLSSGLETALFQLWFVGWTLTAAWTPRPLAASRLARLAAFAALAALARPEGLLCVGATAAWAGLAAAQSRRAALLRGLWPLLAVAAHFLWRRAYYGEWLPNTYFAKSVGSWPAAGWRYLASFVVEQGSWVWCLVAAAFLVALARRRAPLPPAGAVAAAAVAAGLVGYYTLMMGGDHFEYRPFVPLVALGAVSLLAMAAALGLRLRSALAFQLLLLLASTFAWFHHAQARTVVPGDFRPLAPAAPAFLRPLVREFDRWQAWMRIRAICMPQVSHWQLADFLTTVLPPRQHDPEGFATLPMVVAAAVGVVGWNLPDIAILDQHGLNDWVVARNPIEFAPPTAFPPAALEAALHEHDADRDQELDDRELAQALVRFVPGFAERANDAHGAVEVALAVLDRDGDRRLDRTELEEIGSVFAVPRRMAHERKPPPGYFEALRPDVELWYGKVRRTPRSPPLLPDELRAIELEWRARMREH